MPKINAPRGTQDIYGETARQWRTVEATIHEVMRTYDFDEFRGPVFEHTEVFDRGNDGSDVVNKEMYTFMDRGERSLTLRPEVTAGLVRGYVQHKLYASPNDYDKFYYIAPNFRYERPQKGRMRIFHQFGVEVFGVANPLVDAECILSGLDVLNRLGIHDYELHINTLGDQESQTAYKERLRAHFEPVLDELCSDCQRRYEQNPLRMLDCKVDHEHPMMVSAPKSVDSLNDASKAYFEALKSTLDTLGLSYIVDDALVRGLDYYTHTVFEVISTDDAAGSQSTLFGGGRYNQLTEYFEGPQMDAIGFGMGMERLMIALENAEIEVLDAPSLDVYAFPLDQSTKPVVMNIVHALRKEGFSAEMDLIGKSMKAQWKMAERKHALAVLLLGEKEMQAGTVVLKNQKTQEQVTCTTDEVAAWIEKWSIAHE